MISNDEEEEGAGSSPANSWLAICSQRRRGYQNVLAVLDKELQIDFEHRLQKPHICALIQPNLVLPDIHNQNLTRRQRKKRTLPLKILVFTALAAIRTFHIHNQDVFRHTIIATGLPFILAHPYPLCSLPPFLLGHDPELCFEKVVKECGFPRRLGAEDGDEVVIEAGRDDFFEVEVSRQVGAAPQVVGQLHYQCIEGKEYRQTYLNTLSSSITWMPCS